MTASANGITSLMVYKKQSALGTKATASGAQIARRVTAEFNSEADSYSSNEIRQSQQQADTRLGNFRAMGELKGELSAGTYSEFLAALLRKDFVAGPTSGALTTIAATTAGFTDSGNAWLTAGFRVGMIVRPSGFAGAAAVHNTQNFLVTAVTSNLLSCSALNGDAITAEAAGATVTVAATGKRSYVPTSGHTADYFTVEIQDPDITTYRTFYDLLVDKAEIKIPANGMTTIDFALAGLTEDDPDTSEYFTSPTAQTTTGNFSGATALLAVQGALATLCTELTLELEAGVSTIPVIGSKYATGISRGKVVGSGSFTVLLQDDTYLEYFRQETEVNASYAMGATVAIDADAVAIAMPRLKITSCTVDDGEENKIVSCEFDLLEYVGVAATTGVENSTVIIQDTTL